MKRLILVTGTDTGVGKTVLAALLADHLRRQGVRVAALKPVSSGGRGDARILEGALNGALTIDEINPWYFRAPIAPVLAARHEGRRITLAAVLAHIRKVQAHFDQVIVEGAGGLLSPIGEKFSVRELAAALPVRVVIVCPNRIGAVNQARLVLETLPLRPKPQASVVLMATRRADVSARTNAGLLAEFFDSKRIFSLPWLGESWFSRAPSNRRVTAVLQALADA